MNAIQRLHAQGQSIWYDNIQRRLLENGDLAQLIKKGEIRGVTSNPSIFNNAIAHSSDYDAALKPMAWSGWSAEQIFWKLAVEDIQAAADLFLDLHHQTNGGDGYVSLEVDPRLANDTKGTISEAKRLWRLVNRPNLMVKIPATEEGVPAIRAAIAAGVNVNVTLIFSIERYHQVMNAYMEGLEARLEQDLPVVGIASVASFFVSRLDTKVDAWLQAIIDLGSAASQAAGELLGKTAITNTRLAYEAYQKTFSSDRFLRLKARGARVQRPLWASTSTKNPSYSDTMYVDQLIAPDTVNTIPPQTLDAFRDHGKGDVLMDDDYDMDRKIIAGLEKLGISYEKATTELEIEGVSAFSTAYSDLLGTIEKRIHGSQLELGSLANVVREGIRQLEEANAIQRMFNIEPDLWVDDAEGQAEISKRLGWLNSPQNSEEILPDIRSFASECLDRGLTHALLLGMGGSSLAPEVMRQILGTGSIGSRKGLDLAILDSTHPDQVHTAALRSPIDKTLYIVSSKSGTTSEVNAMMEYFWHRTQRRLGEKAGDHFIAITDAGSALDSLAQQRGFRMVFHADPSVGGRYSALTAFGLVPAALVGLDLERLLRSARKMAHQCGPLIPYGRNPGLVLGVVMGEAARAGRDKLVIFSDPVFAPFASWLEQLVAESSGKHGKGIIPVDDGYLLTENDECSDRLYVYLRCDGVRDDQTSRLREAGCPVIELQINDTHQLGALFYQWEIAVAIACAILKVNPFDQPDVQDNKSRTSRMVETYRREGSFGETQYLRQIEGVQIFGQSFPGIEQSKTFHELIEQFLGQVRQGDYIAINAYMPRNRITKAHLQQLRSAIRKRTGRVVTLGFGPRFLHSTGQLHKGGPNNGLFIEITSQPVKDVDIPGFGMTFGTLLNAQALGDLEALLARDRRAIRVHFTHLDLGSLVDFQE